MASSTHLRRSLGVLSSLLLAGFLVTGLAGTSHAADGYRYWNYFHLENGSWAFSQVGAADYQPEDGAVEGYRFGTSTTADGIPPRADLTEVSFETVCAGTEAAAGQKRVAVLIDYGTEADADGTTPPEPRAACASVDAAADGAQVLDAVAEIRAEKSLTCALDGYPVKGCGEPVADAPAGAQEQPVAFQLPPEATAEDTTGDTTEDTTGDATTESADGTDDDSLLLPALVAGAVVLLGGGAFLLSRRNKNA